MRKRGKLRNASSATVFADLALASWETIARRSAMIAAGTCSPAEYARMVGEKIAAAQQSGLALLFGRSPSAVVAPWRRKARANAQRLRGKR
jgi:hypothetical protein